MAFNNVEIFLKGAPNNYNFEFECDVDEYIQLPAFERYLTYQATNPVRKQSVYDSGKQFATEIINSGKYCKLGDCDGSVGKGNVSLIHDIYSKLWKWKKGTNTTFGYIQDDDFKCQFGGETINSMNTILNGIVKDIVYKDENVHLLNKKIGRNISINYILSLYAEFRQEFINKIISVEGMSEYANSYHTLGNFTLVPSGFNQWRGFNKEIKDYWDLSLGYLKEHGWKNKFNCDGNAMKDYYSYINYFFLWDYVDEYGNYVRLLQSDNDNIDNKKRFLKTVIKFIKRRSIFMDTMLRLKLELGEVEYTKLRNRLFLKNDGVYGDYDDVISKIKNSIESDMKVGIIHLLSNAQKDINKHQI